MSVSASNQAGKIHRRLVSREATGLGYLSRFIGFFRQPCIYRRDTGEASWEFIPVGSCDKFSS